MNSTEVPSRIQEEIAIYNMSLPGLQVSSFPIQNDDYQPVQVDLLRTVECPVCRCIPTGPIYNCRNGHFVCNACRPRLPLQKCPCCSTHFTTMRNYPLESILSARAFVCDFHHAGCKKEKMTIIEYENHMRECRVHSLSKSEKSARLQFSVENNMQSPETDLEFKCARCGSLNSKRKLKCRSCLSNLRSPTPMCGRSPLRAVTENELRHRD